MFSVFTFFSDVVEWLFWKVGQTVAPFLPWRLLILLAEPLGLVYFLLSPTRRKQVSRALQVHMNLAKAGHNINRLILECYMVLCKFQVESLLYPQLNGRNIHKIVKINGIDRLEQAMTYQRGVILLLSHFGNNEIVIPALGYRGYKINQIADRHPPQDIKSAARRMSFMWFRKMSMRMRFNRQDALPCKFIAARGHMRDAVRALKNNEVLMVTGDGRIGKSYAECPFLNSQAHFLTGPIKLGIKYEAPILPVFTLRNKDNLNEIFIEERIDVNENDFPSEEVKIKNCLTRYTSILESYVKSYPAYYANYLWQMSLGVRKGDAPMFIEKENTK